MMNLSEEFHGLLIRHLQETIDFGIAPFKVVLTEEILLEAYREVAVARPKEALVLNKSYGLEAPAEYLSNEIIAKRNKLSVTLTNQLSRDGMVLLKEAIIRRWERLEYERFKRQWEKFIAKRCRQQMPTPTEIPDQRMKTLLTVLQKHAGFSAPDLHLVSGSRLGEKTTQRDLLKLVDRGAVRVEGERRWTRYFPSEILSDS
jgi:hypothetical protein